MQITYASRLTNGELVAEVARLAGAERRATVALIVHLAEFDARRLYEGAGFSSTFKYCLEVLRLSEDAAFNRIQAAGLGRKYPAVLDMLVSGALSPTTARMLAKYMTPENSQELLAAASGKSKQDVERLLAVRFPKPDAAPLVRRLPASETTSTPLSAPLPAIATEPAQNIEAPAVVPGPDPRPLVRPLSEERYLIRFSASAETREKLRRVQDLLGHTVPNGDLAAVFDRALTLLVEDLERRKFGAVGRPRAAADRTGNSRHVPAHVRRSVAGRDGRCCAFLAPDGRRCGERRFLEFHHVHPYGAGGKATTENIQLRCRAHNRYEAELFLGSMYEGARFLDEAGARRVVSQALNPFRNG